ncbi:hypothetical protein psal_cds_853 [Pandoravirus salinus]|uniref:Uncharacterized protein n=1 Tax=Pandoravirus salinus TaxID=1349410 RepID=S4W3P0_9VIRU|nr:hypothetical protein psal_cds_853 [Pandoravirus salinus]AGO84910.1 hypothetical protein psal_cds_853 [Pandoravirus salinus]
MGGWMPRRRRFWRRALGAALCWRLDGYEPCEDADDVDDESHADAQPTTTHDPWQDTTSGIVSNAIDHDRRRAATYNGEGDGKGRLRYARKPVCSPGDGDDNEVCWPSAMLCRLAAMEQPIAVYCPETGDVVYRVDLGEETLECLRDGRRRSWSLTFFVDPDGTDDRRVTLYGLMAPGCQTWSMTFVDDDCDNDDNDEDDGGSDDVVGDHGAPGSTACYRARVHIEPDRTVRVPR